MGDSNGSLNRTVPSNIDSERYIIAFALRCPDSATVLSDGVSPSLFFNKLNQRVYQAICQMWDSEIAVDSVTLKDYLIANTSLLEGINLSKDINLYLINLGDITAVPELVRAHIDILIRCHLQRALIYEGVSVESAGYTPYASTKEVLIELNSHINRLQGELNRYKRWAGVDSE